MKDVATGRQAAPGKRTKRIDQRHAGMNVSLRQLTDNIKANMNLLQDGVASFCGQGHPAVVNPDHLPAVLLAGGPSIALYTTAMKRILQYRTVRGTQPKLFTVNGAYTWAVQRGMMPDYQIILDARAENARFIPATVPHCYYLLATQVHPEVVANVPLSHTVFWHNEASPEVYRFLKSHQYMPSSPTAMPPVKGGPTVVTRALPLLYMMGYWQIALFGADSSFASEEESHAYAQGAEGEVVRVRSGDRVFLTTPWMVDQIRAFFRVMKVLPHMQVVLHGDTLLTRAVVKAGSLPNVRVFI